jgi:hypothetical protein
MRAGAGRDAACDLPAIQYDDMGTFEGEFIRRGDAGNTRADDDDFAFLVALKRCGARGDGYIHPKRLAAPIDELVHWEIPPVENESRVNGRSVDWFLEASPHQT